MATAEPTGEPMPRVSVGRDARARRGGTSAARGALGLLAREPRAGRPLRGRLRGLWSLRVGAYRVIYQLTDAEQTVRVAAIRHRAIAHGRHRASTQGCVSRRSAA